MSGDVMPLAYILKNDKPVAQTNREGIASIEKADLIYGDRLTTSFVGATSNVIIYSKEIERSEWAILELTPDFELDEIVVSAEVDGWSVFQKYTNIPIIYEERHDTKLEFRYTYSKTGTAPRTIQGTALINKENSRMTQWNPEAYEPHVLLKTSDDTTELKLQLLTDIFFTLTVANGAVYRVGQGKHPGTRTTGNSVVIGDESYFLFSKRELKKASGFSWSPMRPMTTARPARCATFSG
ncbi:MAG: hypothetical protein LUD68_02650 [Rikenellaceae bacterium]|nr:hypothetical protein [Rikenellaceae bacterium]